MALARPPISTAGMHSFRVLKHRRLALLAIAIGALCSIAAFASFWWRDQSQPRVMINEQSSPALASAKGASVPSSSPQGVATDQSNAAAAANPLGSISPGMKPFSISKASGLVPLGAVQIRVLNTYPATNVYDLSVVAGGRSFSHRHLKVNEPLWIAGRNGSGAIELIVKLVQSDAITGYWTESNRLAHVSSRRRAGRK